MNTFGTSALKFGLCDPRDVRINRQRFRRDDIPSLEKTNTFVCPIGRDIAEGYILLPLKEYQQLNSYATSFQLTLGTTVLQNLAIVQAQCVSKGLTSDPNALYLIEVTDARGVLCNEWFKFPINAQYNMRAPAYPQLYYSGSLNAGTAWTWSTMVGNLWPSLLGTYTGLPSVPTGTPENWYFAGVSVWDALCDVLDHLGMVVAYNPMTAVYSVVAPGTTDTVFTSLQTKYLGNLEDDLDWLDAGSGRFPKTLVVYFKIRSEQYGQEETVRRDSSQWSSTPLYAISVATPYTTAAGTHFLHDDFSIRVDYDNNPLAADVATATTIATERMTQYFRTIPSFRSQMYAGALPFYTGSQVDKVTWSPGWRTTITRGE